MGVIQQRNTKIVSIGLGKQSSLNAQLRLHEHRETTPMFLVVVNNGGWAFFPFSIDSDISPCRPDRFPNSKGTILKQPKKEFPRITLWRCCISNNHVRCKRLRFSNSFSVRRALLRRKTTTRNNFPYHF